MRKNRTILFIIAAVFVLLVSCEKVIQLDLSSSTPQLVIQGNVYSVAGPYKVKISKTVNFDAANIYPAVTNATVTISDDTGQSETLSQIVDGTYATSNLLGLIGHTYTLTVEVDGKTYTASSTILPPAHIDSIYYKNSSFGGSETVALNFMNFPGKENYYRIIHFINGVQIIGFNAFSYKFDQPEEVVYSFMSTENDSTDTTNPSLKKGDTIDVWLESIDKGVYDYFRTAKSGSGQNVSPANPVSNISNGALGYFCACSVSKKSIIYR